MIVTAEEMRALEAAAFARGISAEALMDQAGERCAQAARELFPTPGVCVAVFGKGNNGGDALVMARHLASAGWKVHLAPAFPEEQWNALVREKFYQCEVVDRQAMDGLEKLTRGERVRSPLLVLDGLLGVGAKGPLRGAVAEAARAINALRERAFAQVLALDLPTGLDTDSGDVTEGAVRADFTLAIGAAKRGLLVDGAAEHVGRLVVIPLDELATKPGGDDVSTPASLAGLLPRRSFEMHKGNAGRVAIVAGSRGLTGAAVLCAGACVRAGVGLVALHVPEDAYEIVAAHAPPEVMVKGVASYLEVLETRHDVLAIGPGLGSSYKEEVLRLIREEPGPAVIDADGLNILARDLGALSEAKGPRLLTPHPLEMQRLAGEARGRSRAEIVREFTQEHAVTLLLKGARTVIGQAGRSLAYNTAGNPGMASGGMGDVLTGVCAALAGQKLALYDAARVGAWVCGRAAELAVLSGAESEESLCASDVIAHLGRAFHALRTGLA